MKNRVKALRQARGWSQEELAQRSGVSRSGISAIEIERLIPSADAALAIAQAFGVRFEEVFFLEISDADAVVWVTPPDKLPCRYWQAAVGGRRVLYSSADLGQHILPHDGVFDGKSFSHLDIQGISDWQASTLVVATCDPAVGLLASELARTRQVRLLVLPLSSRAALSALGKRFVHAAGVHFAGDAETGNDAQVRTALGPDYRLLRVARWQSGLAIDPSQKISSVKAAVQSKLRWVGREPGSAARQCLDKIRGDRVAPKHLAKSHRGVVEAIRSGYAEVGVCVELVAAEAGLTFVGIREEPYDLCFAAEDLNDPRIRALIDTVKSPIYRRLLADLPGISSAEAGRVRAV